MNEYAMPFGKFRGQDLRSVPTEYLTWLLRVCKLSTGLRGAVRAELLARADCPSDLPPEPGPPDLVCRNCGGVEVATSWQGLTGGRRAIRGDCSYCGRFIAFLPQTALNVARANEGGAHERQLVQHLGGRP